MPFIPAITTESDASGVRDQLRAAGEYLRDLRARPEDQRGDTWAEDVRSAIDAIHELDPMLTALERGAVRMPDPAGPAAAFAGLDRGRRSPGTEFTESEGYTEWAQRGGRGGYEAEVRTLLSSGDTDDLTQYPAGVWRPVGTPTLRPGTERRMRLFVRDVISVQQTGLASVPYIREVNAVTNEGGAGMVAEGSAKPEVTMEFQQVDAPVRKVAAWIPATEEILADAPTLRGYIDTRLAYMVMLREEAQVLAGNGTAPQVRGITETSGTQTQTAVSGDYPATIGSAIAKIEAVDGDADAVAVNPLDYWAAVTARHATSFDGGANLVTGSPVAAPPNISWGLNEVRTRAMSQGSALVGAYFLGATIFQRSGVTIRVGDQHADYFVANKVAILAEERFALAVHRPDWFVETALDL